MNEQQELNEVCLDGLASITAEWKEVHPTAWDVLTGSLSLAEAKEGLASILRECNGQGEAGEGAAMIASWFIVRADKVQIAQLMAFLEDED